MEKSSHDIVIIGAGAAGLRAAIEAASKNPKLSVALISKVYPMRSHTVSAEGGAAAVIKSDDNFDLHAYDTIKGSDFLADQDAVELFVRLAPKEIIRLEHWGCPWNRDEEGKIDVRWFGGMSVKRTIHAADKTGFYLLHTLFQTSLKYENIVRYDEYFVTSLIIEDNRFCGVTALSLRDGKFHVIKGKAGVIATGGAGQIYKITTNGAINTGDGMALAYKAGLPLKDMEFVQFHPTCLPGSGILISEAARGEGGYLLNNKYERFLKNYVPNKMELGPRDIISRSMINEIKLGNGFKGKYGDYLALDLRHLGEEKIENKLPQIRELAKTFAGVDPVHELVPVRPGQHYFMGGIHVDINTSTPVAGLYSAGEASCVSINGANRLGSNSLPECLVFGAISGEQAARFAMEHDFVNFPPEVAVVSNSPRQCDLMIITGPITHKMAQPLRTLYEQMAEPRYVIATGECSICGGPWKGMYSVVDGADQIIPVDVYIPGCPPKPESLLEGIIKLEEKILKGEVRKKFLPPSGVPKLKADWRS